MAIAAAIPTFFGCSAASEHPSTELPSYKQPNTPPPVVNSVAQGSCDKGAQRKCSVILGKYDGITSCFVGVQVCTDNLWGPCQDPKTIAASAAGGAGGQSAAGAGGEVSTAGGEGGFVGVGGGSAGGG